VVAGTYGGDEGKEKPDYSLIISKKLLG